MCSSDPLMLVLNPTYTKVHFEHMNTLYMTFGFEAIGILWIRKIVNFDF